MFSSFPMMSFSGEKNTVSVEDFLELLEILLEGLDTQTSDTAWRERAKVLVLQSNLEGKAKQFMVNLRPDKKTTYDAAARALRQRFPTPFDEVYWFPEVVDAYEKPMAQVLQTPLPNQNQSRVDGSYLQQAWIQSVSETPSMEMVIIADELVESVEKGSVIHAVHLPDENLGLVPETDPAGIITVTDELVVDENQSRTEDNYVQSAIDQTSHTQTITVAYVEHLSGEDSGLVSKTNPVGMITIVPELAESVEKEVDPEDWKQVSTFVEDKRMEVTGHTHTKSPIDNKPKCHVKILEWDLEKSLRQILNMGLITGQLAVYGDVYDSGGGSIYSVEWMRHCRRGQGVKLVVYRIVYDPGGAFAVSKGWITSGGDKSGTRGEGVVFSTKKLFHPYME
ncbi:hypothetical protein BGX38DRAFT_598235 [Terfezia claveryi]|nr:hypothetical protein BGX38DRAFT_598235 [Terfezia claveryi]